MKIITVFKTHFDYGYTNLAEDILAQYTNVLFVDAISVCEKTQKYGKDLEYKWTVPAFLLMHMLKNCKKDIYARAYALVQRGQIVCHALPFTTHTEMLDERQLKKLFVYADDFSQTYNKPFPIAAKMTDVPGHTAALVTALCNKGVKFLHLGKNPASTSPKVPLLFWWEDLKGNRILTMFNQSYGSQLFPPKDWKYPVWLALMQTGDNVGAQDVDYILKLKKQIGDNYKFTTGTLDDFAKEILKCDLSDLPVIRGEMGDTWIHGIGSYPIALSNYRRAKRNFYELEDYAKNQNIDITSYQNNFYEFALKFAEHTFGINILKFFGTNRNYDKVQFCKDRQNENYKFAEKSWVEKADRAMQMLEIVKKLSQKLNYIYCEKNEVSNKYKAKIINNQLYVFTPNGKKIKINYEYRIFGTDKINEYMKKYLQRYVDWSISDYGRSNYPEVESQKFIGKLVSYEETANGMIANYSNSYESNEKFGNSMTYQIILRAMVDGMHIEIIFSKKPATLFVEAGNMNFFTNCFGKDFVVQKSGVEVNVANDIVENSNQILWAMDNYVRIDDLMLYSIDAPLVSFSKNAIAEWNCGKPRKNKPNFVVNLFNNHWGTNFPQWIEGDMKFEFVLKDS